MDFSLLYCSSRLNRFGNVDILLMRVWLFQQNGKEDIILKRADTRKVRSVGDDTLIVTIEVGMEMNRGYCTTPDGRSTKPFKFDNT